MKAGWAETRVHGWGGNPLGSWNESPSRRGRRFLAFRFVGFLLMVAWRRRLTPSNRGLRLFFRKRQRTDNLMPTEAETTDLNATLDSMELDELRHVQKRIERLIADYQTRKRRDAVAAAEKAARKHGFKLKDLVGEGKPTKTGKAAASRSLSPAKYANPDDPQQTWSGLGRRPSWVRDALDAGRSLDDLAI